MPRRLHHSILLDYARILQLSEGTRFTSLFDGLPESRGMLFVEQVKLGTKSDLTLSALRLLLIVNLPAQLACRREATVSWDFLTFLSAITWHCSVERSLLKKDQRKGFQVRKCLARDIHIYSIRYASEPRHVREHFVNMSGRRQQLRQSNPDEVF